MNRRAGGAAVDYQIGALDAGGVIRAEEQHAAGNVLSLAKPAGEHLHGQVRFQRGHRLLRRAMARTPALLAE